MEASDFRFSLGMNPLEDLTFCPHTPSRRPSVFSLPSFQVVKQSKLRLSERCSPSCDMNILCHVSDFHI